MRSASFSVGTIMLTLPKSSGVGCWGSIGGWRLGPFNRRESRIAVAGTWISSNKSEMALSTIQGLSFVIGHYLLVILRVPQPPVPNQTYFKATSTFATETSLVTGSTVT